MNWGMIGWGAGSFGTGTVYNALALFGLFYLTTVVGLEPALAGSLFFITKLYDAVSDPLMGMISDRTRHRLGKRHPYLLAGGVLLGLSFWLIFLIEPLSTTAVTVSIVVLALLIHATAYTVFSVPYLAIPAEMTHDYDERTKMMSYRVLFLMLGVMLGSVGGPKLVALGGEGQAGYQLMALVFAAVAAGAGCLAFFSTASHTRLTVGGTTAAEQTAGFADGLKLLLRNRPFLLLVAVKLLQLAALASVLASAPYLFRFVLQLSTADIGNYLLVFTLAGLVSIPLWRPVIDRMGKRNTYIICVTLYALAIATWVLWTATEPTWLIYARAVLIGVGSTGGLLCGQALLPDTMEYGRLASGKDNAGAYSGIFTTTEKLAGALGPLVVGVALSAAGLVKGDVGAEAQPDSAITAVLWCASLLPAVLNLATIPVLLKYNLSKERLAELRLAAER
ncbi:MAG: MFS transporter [Pseudomonadota bacterium]